MECTALYALFSHWDSRYLDKDIYYNERLNGRNIESPSYRIILLYIIASIQINTFVTERPVLRTLEINGTKSVTKISVNRVLNPHRLKPRE
jgi:hypothetical protein